MKFEKLLLPVLAMILCGGGCVNLQADPELCGTKNNKHDRYIGIMPPDVKTIACISPGYYPGSHLHHLGIELLRKAGYNIKIMPNAFVCEKGKKQAPVQGRVADFYAAWNDPEVNMILCIRGGMGSEELLDNLDWKKLKPRPGLYLQGYSDATMIICAMLTRGVGHPIAGAMSGSLPGLTDDSVEAMRKMHHGQTVGPVNVKTLVPGDFQGLPIAGSLWKLSRLVNKEYCPDTAGKVIFIEASKMKPEILREKLYDLLNKKFFDKVAGVVFCQFANCGKSETVNEILAEIAPKLGVPVVVGYPFGHVPRSYCIDFSRPVVVKNGTVFFPAVDK